MNARELKEAMEAEGIQVEETNYGSLATGCRTQYEAIVGQWQCHWLVTRSIEKPAKLIRNQVSMECKSYKNALEFMTFQKNIRRVTCWQGHSYGLREKDGIFDGTCPRCREYTKRYTKHTEYVGRGDTGKYMRKPNG